MGYAGDTADELNQTDRHYDGGDLRITNRSIDNLTVTGYGRAYTEHTNLQTTPLNTLQSPTATAASVLQPGNRACLCCAVHADRPRP